MKSFDRDEAGGYDRQMLVRVPLYREMHQLAGALLATRLGPSAQVLVVGAGTGTELVAMAEANPGWHFTAVEPSLPMIDQARAKVIGGRLQDRVRFEVCRIEDLVTDRLWDGAVAVLVAHFMPDDGARAGFFGAVAARLAPGAPCILVDLMAPGSADDAGLRAGWRQWALDRGMPVAAADRLIARSQTLFHPITEARLQTLLDEQGFGPASRFIQAFAFGGYLTCRS